MYPDSKLKYLIFIQEAGGCETASVSLFVYLFRLHNFLPNKTSQNIKIPWIVRREIEGGGRERERKLLQNEFKANNLFIDSFFG